MEEAEQWIGKAVSIECENKLGVFQGVIQHIAESELTITRAFRNGVPLRQQDCSVTFKNTDIASIKIIGSPNSQSNIASAVINNPTPVKQPNFANAVPQSRSVTPLEAIGLSFRNAVPAPFVAVDVTQQLANLTIAMGSNTYENASNVQQGSTSNDSWKNAHISLPTLVHNAVPPNYRALIPPKVELQMASAISSASAGNNTINVETNRRNSYNGQHQDYYQNQEHQNSQGFGSDSGSVRKRYGSGGDSNGNASSGGNSYGRGNNYNYGHNNGRGNRNGGGSWNGQRNGHGQRNGNGYSNKNNNVAGYKNGSGSSNARGNGNGNWNKIQNRRPYAENQTFDVSADDLKHGKDFDFEGNLALFDKRTVFNVIEMQQNKKKPTPAKPRAKETKYRHNENILPAEPVELQQIESIFESTGAFVTDEGLIIPAIPVFVRSKIEITADKASMSFQRQFDMLARGATDLAIMLVGGARRLIPSNSHQWPVVVIICNKQDTLRTINIGASVGRQLAGHGLKVALYIEDPNLEKTNVELSLFKATGNKIVNNDKGLPRPDLVIVSSNEMNLPDAMMKWLNENRAPILAIDPPPGGINNVGIKHSILPILPLNGISMTTCGKLYLCNLGIPASFYKEAGLKYKSPFGHKYVIPIHSKD